MLKSNPVNIKSSIEAAWLAGMLEGDGSFGIYEYLYRIPHRFPVIQFINTDKTLLNKVKNLIGARSIINTNAGNGFGRKKICYGCKISGSKNPIELIRIILPYMIGEKRKIAEEIIKEFG